MLTFHALALTALSVLLIGSSQFVLAAEVPRLEAREWGLPSFQSRELEKDLPIRDFLVSPDEPNRQNGTVWMLGSRSLWQWNLSANTLKRILILWEDRLLDEAKNSEQLIEIGTDGSSVFVGSTRFVYQLAASENNGSPKVLRYKIPRSSKLSPVGFVGKGDRFMWVTSSQAFLVDRYGKKLQAVGVASNFRPTDILIYEPGSNSVLLSRDKQTLKLLLNKTSNGDLAFGKAESVQKLTNSILGMSPMDGGYFIHTAYTVMRQDFAGKRIQTIPVENDRRLRRTDMAPERHAYVFEDGLLEVFDLNPEVMRRYQISSEVAKNATEIQMADETNLIVLSAGKITAYSLSRGVTPARVSRK